MLPWRFFSTLDIWTFPHFGSLPLRLNALDLQSDDLAARSESKFKFKFKYEYEYEYECAWIQIWFRNSLQLKRDNIWLQYVAEICLEKKFKKNKIK